MIDMTKAAMDVLAERERQKAAEGWTPEHDDEHADGSMAKAAAMYAVEAVPQAPVNRLFQILWPWSLAWWKPKGHRQNLVRAGALILAEIERLDRAKKAEGLDAERGTGAKAVIGRSTP